MGKSLYVFDMDGTLIPGTTACMEISKITDRQQEILELERNFAEKIIDTVHFAKSIYNLWRNLDQEIIHQAFDLCPKLSNIKKVTRHISDHHGYSCIITMSPDFFAKFFYEYGFDFIFAAQFPKSRIGVIDTKKILSPFDKVTIMNKLCRKHQIDKCNTYAFGDSMSDRYIFEALENTVSVNGDSHINSLAKFIYQGNDLWDAYSLFAESDLKTKRAMVL